MDLSGHEGEIPMPLTRERMGLSGIEGEIPISIPIPISSTYGAGIHIQNHGHSIIHDSPPINGPGPTPPLSLALAEDHDHHHHQHHNHNHNTYSSKKGAGLKYRECLKNHAASIGGNATDGCGEFMPSGEEGTLEALKCSACSCHRNFHRKEVEGEASSCECFHHLSGRGQKGLLIGYGGGPGGSSGFIPRPSPHHMIMPLGALQTSESDEMEGVGGLMARPLMVKKRFRTKFTPEQKEKMLGFAERAGWKLQKQEESVVQQFCQEIGVKRRVLKVWMHNNKHNLAKKDPLQLE